MKYKGISLIALIITIVVIIIISGVVLSNLTQEDLYSNANKAVFLSDTRIFQIELNNYIGQQYQDNSGVYDYTTLQANEYRIIHDSVIDNTKTINDVIPSISKNVKYAGQFCIINGELAYQGADIIKQDWAREINVKIISTVEPTITIGDPSSAVVEPGIDILYTVKFASDSSLAIIDLANNVEITDINGVLLSTQPTIGIGETSGSSSDLERQVDITIETDNLANGEYYLRIKAGSVINSNNISNSSNVISNTPFSIDNGVEDAPINMLSYRGNIGTIYTFIVTGNAYATGTVWGTDIYTDDSNIAKAVIHAGILTNGQTGTVKIEMLGGMSSYNGTTRNGITTVNYGNWEGSYRFVNN